VTALGEKIKTHRKNKGYTIARLAELACCSSSYIWNIEAQNVPRPSAEKINQIAAVLGVTTEYLLDKGDALQMEDVVDEAFCQRYKLLNPILKKRMRQMMEVWIDELER
jgi:transcriptional regulator with XRE-family HTH domain